jgi:hypothetical protein
LKGAQQTSRDGNFGASINYPLRGRQENFRKKKKGLKKDIYTIPGPHPRLALPLNARSDDVHSEIAKIPEVPWGRPAPFLPPPCR